MRKSKEPVQEKPKKQEEDSPLKKLSWLPELKYAIEDWQMRLEKAEAEVKRYKQSINTTKSWVKETEAARPELFAQILADPEEVIKAYVDGRPPFLAAERKQIHQKHNHLIISRLAQGDIHRLKEYIWGTEPYQTNEDWEYFVQSLIDIGDEQKIKTILECRFDRFPKEIRKKLVEYIESRKLAEYMAEAK